MGKIIWAPSALKDMESIARFIERDSIDQASLFVTRVIEMTDRLDDFPQSGRVIPEINDDHCREIIYGAYRVMYRIAGDEIWITGVIHGARNWHPG
jgi:toxin ParE1/3/4